MSRELYPDPAPIPLPEPPGNLSNLWGRSRAALEDLARRCDQPAYRGAQLYEWLYVQRTCDLGRMTNLPAAFRMRLQETAGAAPLISPVAARLSQDGSRKFLFQLNDGERVESVLIPEGRRLTLCLSTQVGCLVGCRFCATGVMGFRRNLSAGEILGQFLLLDGSAAAGNRRLTNVVMMGMGEPLLNRRAVFQAIELLIDPKGINLSRRRVTVSTAGWVPGIRALAASGLRVRLAVSLNATTDAQRRRLMPLVSKYSLAETIAAVREYRISSDTRPAISYLLLAGLNDADADAARLARLARAVPAKVNLMEFNPLPGGSADRPADSGMAPARTPRERAVAFLKRLADAGVTVTLRTSRGTDVQGACGQLAAAYPPQAGKSAPAVLGLRRKENSPPPAPVTPG